MCHAAIAARSVGHCASMNFFRPGAMKETLRA